ncbi:MAG: carbohydrate kinase family protein, partial [Acidobacteriaceae bacterium]
ESPSAFKKTECAVPGNPARECDALARFRAVPENRYLHHGLLSTSLDPDYDPSGKWDGGMLKLLPFVDIFLPNELETTKISGETDIARAVDILSKLSRIVVVKRGAAGVSMKYREQVVNAPAFSVQPVDTTGAGDSFNAGFIFRFLQGAPLADCTAWGNACGALSTRSLGGTEGFPTASEVEKFFLERTEELENIHDAFAST